MDNKRQQGVISSVITDKNFGFIRPAGSQKEIFFHFNQYRGLGIPSVGDSVYFIPAIDHQGRPCATYVQEADFVHAKHARQQAHQRQQEAHIARIDAKNSTLNATLCFAAIFYLLLIVHYFVSAKSLLSTAILAIYSGLGVITFMVYWLDKIKAQDKYARRTPEKVLHNLALAGGWIGAAFAHKLLNHKSTKAKFRQMYYFTIAVNIIALAVLVYWLRI